ncbi:MFS transporter [Clostridium sp. KNHs216]|uniref:MFS transporter n=1 Tax=Clostridium sp. KNHs216 TaxID=1550235 RepID=UPI00114F382D|nr:MFS transporter [Clostridium sp. KNHs216]TQI68920.1 fucose permease [Clostridium sp. KNHs216]
MIFLALIYLAFISLGLPDAVLGSSWPIMNVEFRVPVGNAGFVSIMISACTILSSLFSHRLIRRFGTGKVTVVSVALTAVALLGFSVSPSFLWLLACAVPLGLGAGAVDSGLNEFVAEHYEAKHMNWLHCFWGVGAMLGPALISVLALWGRTWRSGYFSISIIQFALVALLIFSLPMWKKFENPSAEPVEEIRQGKEKHSLFTMLRAKGSVFVMLSFLLNASMEASMMLWGASYLVKMKGILPESAAGWVSLFFLGVTVGRMVSGFVSMKLSNEALIHIGTIFLIVGFVFMILPLPALFAIGAFILVGLGLAPIYPSMLHQTPVYFGKENAQAVMGLQMSFAYTGNTLMAPLFGQLFANVSFSLMPCVLLVCAVGLLACRTHLISITKKKSPDQGSEDKAGDHEAGQTLES